MRKLCSFEIAMKVFCYFNESQIQTVNGDSLSHSVVLTTTWKGSKLRGHVTIIERHVLRQ